MRTQPSSDRDDLGAAFWRRTRNNRKMSAPPAADVRRFLVVANQTSTSPALIEAIAERVAIGPSSWHVVVPMAGANELARLASLAFDPVSGFGINVVDLPLDEGDPRARAEARLASLLEVLEGLDVPATGEIGDEDPCTAVRVALARRGVDEILVSTLPAGMSRWISMDLISRIARKFPGVITHVEAKATAVR